MVSFRVQRGGGGKGDLVAGLDKRKEEAGKGRVSPTCSGVLLLSWIPNCVE